MKGAFLAGSVVADNQKYKGIVQLVNLPEVFHKPATT